MDSRFDRNIRFFGEEGQRRLRQAKVAIVGVGGVGGHVVQQLAFLGVGSLTLIDSEELDDTNRNRYVTSRSADPVPGAPKVDIGERLILETDATVRVLKVRDSLVSEPAFDSLIGSDYVFGCIDSEGGRLILTELCAAYSRPYFDVASDIEPGDKCRYGGRVCASLRGESCLVCLGQIDIGEAQLEIGGLELRETQEAIYGVKRQDLGRKGPSVVSLNGVVSSLAVTEFMLAVTGMRDPHRLLLYLGHLGKVVLSQDPPQPGCYYCKGLWGIGDKADVQRYIRSGVGRYLR